MKTLSMDISIVLLPDFDSAILSMRAFIIRLMPMPCFLRAFIILLSLRRCVRASIFFSAAIFFQSAWFRCFRWAMRPLILICFIDADSRAICALRCFTHITIFRYCADGFHVPRRRWCAQLYLLIYYFHTMCYFWCYATAFFFRYLQRF